MYWGPAGTLLKSRRWRVILANDLSVQLSVWYVCSQQQVMLMRFAHVQWFSTGMCTAVLFNHSSLVRLCSLASSLLCVCKCCFYACACSSFGRARLVFVGCLISAGACGDHCVLLRDTLDEQMLARSGMMKALWCCLHAAFVVTSCPVCALLHSCARAK